MVFSECSGFHNYLKNLKINCTKGKCSKRSRAESGVAGKNEKADQVLLSFCRQRDEDIHSILNLCLQSPSPETHSSESRSIQLWPGPKQGKNKEVGLELCDSVAENFLSMHEIGVRSQQYRSQGGDGCWLPQHRRSYLEGGLFGQG